MSLFKVGDKVRLDWDNWSHPSYLKYKDQVLEVVIAPTRQRNNLWVGESHGRMYGKVSELSNMSIKTSDGRTESINAARFVPAVTEYQLDQQLDQEEDLL